jgi:hypothetical protein
VQHGGVDLTGVGCLLLLPGVWVHVAFSMLVVAWMLRPIDRVKVHGLLTASCGVEVSGFASERRAGGALFGRSLLQPRWVLRFVSFNT